MSRVGEKIKEARLKSGMTQKILAKKLGVAEKFINEVETGRRIVQESFIDKAAKILNADLPMNKECLRSTSLTTLVKKDLKSA